MQRKAIEYNVQDSVCILTKYFFKALIALIKIVEAVSSQDVIFTVSPMCEPPEDIPLCYPNLQGQGCFRNFKD